MPQYKNNIQATYPTALQAFIDTLYCNLGSYQDCPEFSVAGISRLFFANFSKIGTAYLNTDGEVTSFANPLITEWLYLPFNKFSPTIDTTLESNAGGMRYQTVIKASISKQTSQRRNIFIAMASGRYGCIALDKNDTYWLIGNQYPLRNYVNEKNSGAGATDFNGDSIELSCYSTFPPRVITEAAIAELVFDLSENCAVLAGYPAAAPLPLAALATCPLILYENMIL